MDEIWAFFAIQPIGFHSPMVSYYPPKEKVDIKVDTVHASGRKREREKEYNSLRVFNT